MENNSEGSKAKAFLMPIIVILLGVIIFLPAWSLRFWEGWVWWSIMFGVTVFISIYLVNKNPGLLQRRTEFKQPENIQKPPAYLNLFWLGYIIPGLDFRFHWSNVPFGVIIAANVMFFLSYVLIFLVFKQNTYASATVQVEDQQQLITTGLYSVVRNPMYLGLLFMGLFTPLALGSYWAIIPKLWAR